MSFKSAILTGIGTAILMYGIVEAVGHNYYTWTLQLYSYVLLAALVALQASNTGPEMLKGFSDRLLYVVDREDKIVRKPLKGEEFEITGTRKVQ